MKKTHQRTLITYQEASNFTGIPIGTLYALVFRRKVPHYRLGPRFIRFSSEELANWLDKKAVECDLEGIK